MNGTRNDMHDNVQGNISETDAFVETTLMKVSTGFTLYVTPFIIGKYW